MVWKDYSPSHFCGSTGTFNGIDESIPGVPAREKCEPASVGEFWWGPHTAHFLALLETLCRLLLLGLAEIYQASDACLSC